MRRASSGSHVISRAIFLASAVLVCSCSIEPGIDRSAVSGVIHLTSAEFATSDPGDISSHPSRQLKLPAGLNWQAVELPHALPRSIAPSTGVDPRRLPSVTSWYRMGIPSRHASQTITALYLPRWHTWGTLAIYANGALAYSSVDEGIFSSFNDPLLIKLPDRVAERTLEIVVRMDSVRANGGAVTSIWVGPFSELRAPFETRRLLQKRVPEITSFVFLVLGVFALGFWARRRHETTQLLFFVLSILFYVRNLHYYLEDVRISEDWLQWASVNSLGWLNVVVYVYALRAYGRRYAIAERSLIGAMAVASLLSLPFGWFDTTVALFASFTYLVFIGVSLVVNAHLTYVACRVRRLGCVVLAGVLWLNFALGVHDWLLQNWRIDTESIYLLPYGVCALFVFFLASELRRYLGAISASEKASYLLEVRLKDRERELKESYDRLRAVEQAQLLSEERQRLMREMHDGLGSALMSSLVAVERGQMPPQDVAQVLRSCVDDLKLTIDSLEPVGDDLLVLLATLRFRLEPRLDAAGIKLEWSVESVPALPWLNASAALQILRMLQEILTNILKHADARTISVAAFPRGAHEVRIQVTDDGRGFDVNAKSTGRGLKNLQRRAASIKSRIEFESGGRGTQVTIDLPLDGGGAPKISEGAIAELIGDRQERVTGDQ